MNLKKFVLLFIVFACCLTPSFAEDGRQQAAAQSAANDGGAQNSGTQEIIERLDKLEKNLVKRERFNGDEPPDQFRGKPEIPSPSPLPTIILIVLNIVLLLAVGLTLLFVFNVWKEAASIKTELEKLARGQKTSPANSVSQTERASRIPVTERTSERQPEIERRPIVSSLSKQAPPAASAPVKQEAEVKDEMSLLYSSAYAARREKRRAEGLDVFLEVNDSYDRMLIGENIPLCFEEHGNWSTANYLLTDNNKLFINFYKFNEAKQVSPDLNKVLNALFEVRGSLPGKVKRCLPAQMSLKGSIYSVAKKGTLEVG